MLKVEILYTLPNRSILEIVRETWGSRGYTVNPDANSGDTRGLNVWPMTVYREANVRWDAARAYYYPVDQRANSKVLRGGATRLPAGVALAPARRKYHDERC